jgi:hypothetical protein
MRVTRIRGLMLHDANRRRFSPSASRPLNAWFPAEVNDGLEAVPGVWCRA